jgi:hypothetical protein
MNSIRHGTDDTGRHAVAGDGVRVRVRHVDRDDGRHDDALGSANVSHVRPYGPTNCGTRLAIRCNCLVQCRLFPCLITCALLATLVQWAFERTALLDSAMASTSNVVGGLLFVAAGFR